MVSPEVREQLIQSTVTEFPRMSPERAGGYVDVFQRRLAEEPDFFEGTSLQSLARHLKREKPFAASRKELALIVEFRANSLRSNLCRSGNDGPIYD